MQQQKGFAGFGTFGSPQGTLQQPAPASNAPFGGLAMPTTAITTGVGNSMGMGMGMGMGAGVGLQQTMQQMPYTNQQIDEIYLKKFKDLSDNNPLEKAVKQELIITKTEFIDKLDELMSDIDQFLVKDNIDDKLDRLNIALKETSLECSKLENKQKYLFNSIIEKGGMKELITKQQDRARRLCKRKIQYFQNSHSHLIASARTDSVHELPDVVIKTREFYDEMSTSFGKRYEMALDEIKRLHCQLEVADKGRSNSSSCSSSSSNSSSSSSNSGSDTSAILTSEVGPIEIKNLIHQQSTTFGRIASVVAGLDKELENLKSKKEISMLVNKSTFDNSDREDFEKNNFILNKVEIEEKKRNDEEQRKIMDQYRNNVTAGGGNTNSGGLLTNTSAGSSTGGGMGLGLSTGMQQKQQFPSTLGSFGISSPSFNIDTTKRSVDDTELCRTRKLY